jgi:hypothetical protein
MKTRLSLSLALLAGALLAAPSQAAIVVYTDQASFLSALSASGTDTFNDLGTNNDNVPSPLNRSAGAFTYTASVPPSLVNFYTGGTVSDSWLSTDFPTDSVTFSNFSSQVSAFGGFFFATNSSDGTVTSTTVSITATDSEGSVTLQVEGATPTTFRGFVSASLLSVSVSATQAPDVIAPGRHATINNVTAGTAIPEPSAAASLFAVAALAFAAFGRRRRQG